MKKRIEIRNKYKRELLPFSKSPKYFHSPVLSVILKSPSTLKETLFTKKFLIDTGASISIINAVYHDFLKELVEIDTLRIKYGAGNTKVLPIYKVILIINGKEVKSTVAYDPGLPYQLLGHFDFLENFTYSIFDSGLKEYRLIKT